MIDGGGPVKAFDESLHCVWNSAAFLLASALEEFYKDDVFQFKSNISNEKTGYFSDFFLLKNGQDFVENQLEKFDSNSKNTLGLFSNSAIYYSSESDLETISNLMKSLSEKSENFAHLCISRNEAMLMFAYSPFKLHLLSQMPENELVNVYKCGNYVDLSQRPLVRHSGLLLHNKLLRTAASTYSSKFYVPSPNDNPNPLTRIYGIAFPKQSQLKSWCIEQDKIMARDHRNIGKQLELFSIHPLSPGSPFLLPNGTRIANRILDKIRSEYRREGFEEIITPLIFNKELWETSGHWENYRQDMFLLSSKENEKSTQGLKPMNCPGHCLVFANKSYSYRDLPVRFAEFSPLHRNEASGALTGLTRVRKFHQDDAHIFCTPQQIESEIKSTLTFISRIYNSLGLKNYSFTLSTRPEKSLGTDEIWQSAELALKNALDSVGSVYSVGQGDGAFYGPKIDVMINDGAGRLHQTATIQLDFNLPMRFELLYVDENGDLKTPVMIHRAALGSVERMLAILIEENAGRFPFWMSPRQAAVIPATSEESVVEYSQRVGRLLAGRATPEEYRLAGVMESNDFYYVDVKTDFTESLGKRVRNAIVAKYNYIVIVGVEELKNNSVTVRLGYEKHRRTLGLKQLIEEWKREMTI